MYAVIPADIAKRVQLAVSTEETRYYLNGFCVQPSPAGGVEVCATDGHILSLFRAYNGQVDREPGQNWPIVQLSKTELAAAGKPIKHMGGTFYLVVEGDHARSTVTLVMADDSTAALESARNNVMGAIAFQANGRHFVDGSFPNYRRVIPDGPMALGSAGTFNVELLARLGKCVSEPKKPPIVTIVHTDHGAPMRVTCDNPEYRDSWLGVIMPCRGPDEAPITAPGWLNPPPVAETPAHPDVFAGLEAAE